MKVLWTTTVKVGNKTTEIEKDSPNTIMDYAAALYLHRLEQLSGTGMYEKIKYIALGSDSSNPTSTSEETLVGEFARVDISSSFRYENNYNVIVLDYSFENVTGAEIEITERGVVSGGVDSGLITDVDDRSLTGYLVSRQTNDPILLPEGGVLYGTIRLFLNI